MTQPQLHRAPKTPQLAEQQADYTAEGAPPPGKLARSESVTVQGKVQTRSTGTSTEPASRATGKPARQR